MPTGVNHVQRPDVWFSLTGSDRPCVRLCVWIFVEVWFVFLYGIVLLIQVHYGLISAMVFQFCEMLVRERR